MPLPWWASQSTMRTRSPRSASTAAVTATLFSRQKPIARPGSGVVAGRAHGQEGGVGLAPVEALDGVEAGAGGQEGGRPRLGDGARVGVEVAAAGGAEALEGVEVGRRVETLELGPRGRPGRHRTRRPRRGPRLRCPASTAWRRAGRSGWPGPVSCAAKAGCVVSEHGNLRHGATLPTPARRCPAVPVSGPGDVSSVRLLRAQVGRGAARAASACGSGRGGATRASPTSPPCRRRPRPRPPWSATPAPSLADRGYADVVTGALARLRAAGLPRRRLHRAGGAPPPRPRPPRPAAAAPTRRCAGAAAGTGPAPWPSTPPPSTRSGGSTRPASTTP